MIISPQSLDTNLSQLLAEVKFGSMQLPEFQRDWTWDDNRIRGIIASLSQGYPMGAIMRLQYGNPDIQFKYRTITGVKGVSVKPEHLILDGQQRLTSIYQATSSKEPVSTKTEKGKAIKRYYYLSMEKCLDDDEDRFDAVLSIPEDRKIKENFDRDVKLDLSTREYEYENKLFPVNIVFDSNAPIPDLPDRKTICIMERGNEKCQPKNENTQRRRVTMRPSRRRQCGWSPSRGGPAGRWPRNSASASTRCAAG